ncbi:acyl carrier protein [Hyphomonas johnsonii MHS-2]|uniref:Acyl carrier protein n=1 Tax=Hyphomonas johnsonii MHS-2 TaxID=1280950 RepID=A0A059FBF4_9PROT|nr:acyl carrier protein [Hyphomonas johnsonii]KCZ87944.1 acyl carrier protein [Hyphomonas johnsonii MHS-2]
MCNVQDSHVFENVSKILKAHAHADILITPDVRISADLEIDSVEIFDIVMEIEDIYDISFPVEVASSIDTVRDLVETIGQLTNV